MPFGQPSPHNPNNSFEVPQPPSDGISSLAFSPTADLLVATSWDKKVRCWEVQQSGQSVAKAAIDHDQPVLDCAWSGDGSVVFSGGCDKTVKMWNLQSNQQQQVAAHDAPVRHVAWVEEMKMLITGSWDKTLRYWDTRQQTPVHTQQLPDRVYAMDVKHPLLVVGCADRNVCIINLQNPQQIFQQIQSPLKFQTRCIATFPDKTGYLLGSVEGRVAVQYVQPELSNKNFTFKCHRTQDKPGQPAEIYSVNSISFHPQYGTFATAGADGAYNFWDKDSKQRLKAMSRCNQPITSGTFNRDGRIYAYAVSYDWSKGAENHNPQTAQNHILLHPTQESEVKSRARTKR
mmetsp:Transcript_2007/g.7184  ORF Transcript_2007/g.7184 Transcript_2007/m.7184 type:complete len:345 (+) Transcript_2007:213-1247(+)